jgi:hypothetical protein
MHSVFYTLQEGFGFQNQVENYKLNIFHLKDISPLLGAF